MGKIEPTYKGGMLQIRVPSLKTSGILYFESRQDFGQNSLDLMDCKKSACKMLYQQKYSRGVLEYLHTWTGMSPISEYEIVKPYCHHLTLRSRLSLSSLLRFTESQVVECLRVIKQRRILIHCRE